MLTFLKENLGTIVISAVLFAVLALILASMIRNRRRGKTSCGCGCANCALHGVCHESEPQKNPKLP